MKHIHPQDAFVLAISAASLIALAWVTRASIERGYVVLAGLGAVAVVGLIAYIVNGILSILDA